MAPALAAPVADTFSDPAMEARARALQRQLRCLVCQGESIDESDAPWPPICAIWCASRSRTGKSDSQIKDFWSPAMAISS